jgi:transcriptional regulator with XRE-family HTH domain
MKRARDPDELRAAMAARTLTQREVALLVDCSVGTVGFVLAGKSVNDDLARRFARTLRRPVGELFVVVESSVEQSGGYYRAVG